MNLTARHPRPVESIGPHRRSPGPTAGTRQQSPHSVRGATAIEFALVLTLLITLVLGVLDLGRWLVAAASLHEAARAGARLAVVCDLDDPQVRSRALSRVVGLGALAQPPSLAVTAEPAGCNAANCQRLRVSLDGAVLMGVMPWWGGGLPLPAASVELPRESLSSQLDGRSNPQCL